MGGFIDDADATADLPLPRVRGTNVELKVSTPVEIACDAIADLDGVRDPYGVAWAVLRGLEARGITFHAADGRRLDIYDDPA